MIKKNGTVIVNFSKKMSEEINDYFSKRHICILCKCNLGISKEYIISQMITKPSKFWNNLKKPQVKFVLICEKCGSEINNTILKCKEKKNG